MARFCLHCRRDLLREEFIVSAWDSDPVKRARFPCAVARVIWEEATGEAYDEGLWVARPGLEGALRNVAKGLGRGLEMQWQRETGYGFVREYKIRKLRNHKRERLVQR